MSQNISISVVNDALDEVDETVAVSLSNPVNAPLRGTTTHTYTVTEDDATPTVSFGAGGGTATGSGTDYTLTAGTPRFNPGVTSQNIPVSVVDDVLDESDETVSVLLSTPVNATLGAITSHTYTIIDNDTSTVSFSASSSNGLESVTPANLSVVLSNPSVQTVTVNYAVS